MEHTRDKTHFYVGYVISVKNKRSCSTTLNSELLGRLLKPTKLPDHTSSR
jgi:hypothetical protein